jgi:hypothetical protein
MQIVSTGGWTLTDYRQKCDSQSLQFQQIPNAFHERRATGSITIAYKQQVSTDFSKLWNLPKGSSLDSSSKIAKVLKVLQREAQRDTGYSGN